MKDNDSKLSDLLRQWRDIEPSSNFEASVRRRIRLAETKKPERASVFDLLFGHHTWQPSLALAAAVVVSVLIGSSAGVITSRRPVSVAPAELGFMSAGTLAGGYVQLAAEKPRGLR